MCTPYPHSHHYITCTACYVQPACTIGARGRALSGQAFKFRNPAGEGGRQMGARLQCRPCFCYRVSRHACMSNAVSFVSIQPFPTATLRACFLPQCECVCVCVWPDLIRVKPNSAGRPSYPSVINCQCFPKVQACRVLACCGVPCMHFFTACWYKTGEKLLHGSFQIVLADILTMFFIS